MAELTCEKCARQQPASSDLKQCVYCGAALSQREPEPAPAPVAPAPEAAPASPASPPAAPATPADEPVPEGKRRCPGCGEVLYAEEQRCWRCGAELALAPTAAAAPASASPASASPASASPASASPASASPASASPASASPPAPAPPAVAPVTAPPPPLPYVAAPAASPSAPLANPAALTLGIWALVLSLLGLLCCPPLLPSIIAIVLSVKSRKLGGSPLALASLVIGIIGLAVWVPVVALIIVGMLSPGTTSVTPEATSWLGSVSWLLS